jgi:hypothetical protein
MDPGRFGATYRSEPPRSQSGEDESLPVEDPEVDVRYEAAPLSPETVYSMLAP